MGLAPNMLMGSNATPTFLETHFPSSFTTRTTPEAVDSGNFILNFDDGYISYVSTLA